MRIIPCILMIILTTGACREPLDEEAIIQSRYDQRVEEYRQKKMKECRSRALESADLYVDSLIQDFIGREVLDTITFPKKPARPERPDDIIGTVRKFKVDQ